MRPLALALPFVWVLGCAGGSTAPVDDPHPLDQALADDATDTATASSHGSSLAHPLFAGLDTALIGAGSDTSAATMQVALIADKVLSSYTPAGCAKAERLAVDRVRITFDDCHTPTGLAHVTGGLEARFSGEPLHAHLELSVPDSLTANGADVAYAASADVETHQGAQEITWHTWTFRVTTPRGRIVSHTADYALHYDFDTKCTRTVGVTHGDVSGLAADGHAFSRQLDAEIDNFVVCPGACPSSGTLRSTALPSRRTVTLRFDGSPVVHVVGPHGSAFDVPLACGG